MLIGASRDRSSEGLTNTEQSPAQPLFGCKKDSKHPFSQIAFYEKKVDLAGSLGKIAVIFVIVGGVAIVAYDALRTSSPRGGPGARGIAIEPAPSTSSRLPCLASAKGPSASAFRTTEWSSFSNNKRCPRAVSELTGKVEAGGIAAGRLAEGLHELPGKTAMPLGPLPTGMVRTTAWVAASITETLSSLMFVT